MGTILVLESEVAYVLPGEQPCNHCQMKRNTITLPTCNITNNLSTEDSEGYTQFLQSLGIQFDTNMDQDHKDFKGNEQEEEAEEENSPKQNHLSKSKICLRNPHEEMI